MAKKKKILIVDDDPGILLMLRMMLKLEGYEAIVSEQAAGFVDRIKSEAPDLVLLDAMMPRLDGLTLLNQVKSAQLPSPPPIVLFTGNVDDAYINRALKAGAHGVLRKPFVKEELLLQLKRFLRQKKKS